MDPEKFFDFAKAIETAAHGYIVDEETDCRTGIGRAHYSVFLEFREEIRQKILTIDNALANIFQAIKGKIHGVVLDILLLCDFTLRNQYRDLRNQRNDADYDMGITISQSDLQTANQLARHIKTKINLIQQATLQSSKIADIFRQRRI